MVAMGLLGSFWSAWTGLMNLFDYDIPNFTNSINMSANI